jgi:hypothetical protein
MKAKERKASKAAEAAEPTPTRTSTGTSTPPEAPMPEADIPEAATGGPEAASMTRATSATLQQRIQAVLQIRLDGAEGWDVRQFVAEKEAAGEVPWTIPEGGKPLSERQIRRYVEQADDLIAESCRTSRKQLIRRHLAQRRSLYARAVQAGDIRTALAVLNSLAELQNLFPAKRTEVTGPDGGPLQAATVELTDDERAAAIAAIFATVGKGSGGPHPTGQGDAPRSAVGTA